MTKENRPPRTFVEWVLQLLEERFPWFGNTDEEIEVSGADTVDQLTDLHRELKRRRRTNRRNGGKNGRIASSRWIERACNFKSLFSRNKQ